MKPMTSMKGLLPVGFALSLLGCAPKPVNPVALNRPPVIRPDYTDIVIPPVIAPLNFRIVETGRVYHVRLEPAAGDPLVQSSRDGRIRFPIKAWRKFLDANRGHPFALNVSALCPDGSWVTFAPVTNRIAAEPFDSHLVYRLIPTIHRYWANIAIHDRDLTTFSTRCLVDNLNFGRDSCINCHTFLNRSPDTLSLLVRSPRHGPPMIRIQDGRMDAIDFRTPARTSPAAYHAWHPGGKFIAFSRNKLSPFEHRVGETADVWDENSDLFVFDADHNSQLDVPALANPAWRETWPSWSDDGHWLYFCRAPQIPFAQFRDVRYDLMRLAFDPDTGTWGEPEILVSGKQTGMSAAHPREAPGGRWVLFTLAAFGNFPIYRPEADIYCLDLQTRAYHRLAINSEWCDSWHSWSDNGRWIAFSSKRGNGLMARIYFSHFDGAGGFSKPFVLPQDNPDYYQSCLYTFNVPEFVKGPVAANARTLSLAIVSAERIRPVDLSSTAQPAASPGGPTQDMPWQPAPSAR